MNGTALPLFTIEGGLALALVRGLSVAGLLSIFGAQLFRAALASPVLAQMNDGEAAMFGRQWLRLARASLVMTVLATLAWLVLEAASLADAGTISAAVGAVPDVMRDTAFGHVLLLRLAALALTALALGKDGSRPWLTTGLAAVATGLQAWHGHAASMYDGPSLLLLSQVLHVLAAGAWLGGLLPLLLLVEAASPQAASLASNRFSPLGTACVVLLTGTAVWQSWGLIGGWSGLIGTGYGLMALVKLALFLALLGFAAANRFRFTPALSGISPGLAKQHLRWSITAEAGMGLLIVLAAAVLASLPPAVQE